MSAENFNAYSRYYDLLYKDKDYEGEALYIKGLLARYKVISGQLLEFGSGTGKHGCLLAGHGYNVHGVDLSADMIANAHSAPGFTSQQGDITNVKVDGVFDAVLSLFHVVSYLTSNEQVHATFANAAHHVKSGGLFIFDFWYTPAVYTQKPTVRVKRLSDGQIEITRLAEPELFPNENRVDVHYTIYEKDLGTQQIQMIQETHPMRHFTLPEIDVLAEVHGFERIAAEEFLSGAVASENTWGVCVVLRRV